VKYLVEVAPYLKKKENADRIHFIIAQIYQLKGFDAEAYNYYNQCLQGNPSFELSFYAKLNMAEVTQLTEEQDIKKVRKYFRSLLRDRKNAEFKDKIYYEMANFEKKQKNVEKAIEYYKLSIRSNVNNPRQKGYSYLKLGEIYFDDFKNYEIAKDYYDSVVAVLPKEDDIYSKVAKRQDVLADFVKQIETIHDQDSLLLLAEMDTSAINAIIDQVIEAQKKKADEEADKKKRNIQSDNSAAQTNIFQAFNDKNIPGGNTGTIWYFYNLTAMGIGQNEFKKIWGDRKLGDHWRRSNKESASQFEETNDASQTVVENSPLPNDTSQVNANSEKSQMLAIIPFSEDAKKEALRKVEQAYYNLGNIYNFKLEEKNNAAEAFETLLNRFPKTVNEPEVRYLLYLIYGDLEIPDKKQLHSDSLLSKFPNSVFSKLILNPNYRDESNIASEKLKLIYQKAYHLFTLDSLKGAFNLIHEGEIMYPDNDFSDNLKLLEILIVGKMDGMYRYQFELQEFKKKYPESELLGYVDTLLISSDDFQKEQIQKKEIQYLQYFDQVHYFVIIYPSKSKLTDQLPGVIDEFNKSYFTNNILKIGNLVFDEENSMIIVNEFNTVNAGVDYYKTFNNIVSVIKDTPSIKSYNFVISKDNFQILFQTKGLKEYLEFFAKNY
jgi:hypothetical protein